ncbi:hypothetical protein GC177_04970 [bacterium]|nr:hypothetical protein [bacterium]
MPTIAMLPILKQSTAWLMERWKRLLLVSLLASIAFTAISRLVAFAFSPMWKVGSIITQGDMILMLTAQLVLPVILIKSVLAVYWFRYVLRDEAGRPPMKLIARMFGYSVLVTIVLLLLCGAITLAIGTPLYVLTFGMEHGLAAEATYIGGKVGAVICALLLFRLIWLFPAIALGEPFSFKTAWRIGREHFLGSLGCVLLAAVPFLLLLWGVNTLSMSMMDNLYAILMLQMLVIFIVCIAHAYVLSFIGHAYRSLRSRQ